MSNKKIALIVLGVFVLLLGILAGVIASRPADFSIQRSIVIDAPAERIFPYLNNVKLGQQWSPFEKLDPDMKREFSGPEEGVGAVYAWDGNSNAGQGKLTILESDADKRVRLQLDFIRPFKATNYSEYRLEPAGDASHRVTWEMTGKHNFLGKAVCMIMNMDKAVGGMFEEGLANLKHVVETPSQISSLNPFEGGIDVVIERYRPFTCELIVHGHGKHTFYLPETGHMMYNELPGAIQRPITCRLNLNDNKISLGGFSFAPSNDRQARIEFIRDKQVLASGLQQVVIGSMHYHGREVELQFRINELPYEQVMQYSAIE